MSEGKQVTPRVRAHVDKIREAGLDTQQFFDALTALRDDSALPRAHRDAIYKLIAMESFVWYLEALRNERIDRVKLAEEVNRIGAQYEAAIKKQGPGDKAAALSKADIGAGAPPGAAGGGAPPVPSGAPRASARGARRSGAARPRGSGAGPSRPRKAGAAGGRARPRAGSPRTGSRSGPRRK